VPSPVGHALGAIAIAWPIVPRKIRHGALIVAAAAIAPDLDLLVATHRGASHSIGAALLAGLLAAIVVRGLADGTGDSPSGIRDAALWVGIAVALAWGSHVLLDWLSNDTRPPVGIMALWPLSDAYYKAPIEIFPPVSRRYWESQFWLYNLRAVAVEMLLLGPLAAVALWRMRRAR
jgi:membrane-bound metal-dependent hydrolase YbcI (DUF457 family)